MRVSSSGESWKDFNAIHGSAPDRDGHRVHLFDADGSAEGSFGAEGSGVGQLRRPAGVAVDREGHVVVVDGGNCRVQVFRRDGTLVRCFGSQGDGPGELQNPHGVAVGDEGKQEGMQRWVTHAIDAMWGAKPRPAVPGCWARGGAAATRQSDMRQRRAA